jgi:hypothetical protein
VLAGLTPGSRHTSNQLDNETQAKELKLGGLSGRERKQTARLPQGGLEGSGRLFRPLVVLDQPGVRLICQLGQFRE